MTGSPQESFNNREINSKNFRLTSILTLRLFQTTRVVTAINGHRDKRSSEILT